MPTRTGCGRNSLRRDERGLSLAGFLVFLDRPKTDARASLERLAELGITVKIATGDNALVAEKVLSDIGITSGGTLSGADIDALSDEDLRAAATTATIFARVSPEQKARLIRLLRHAGRSVGFLGDGVNDALALHQADIGVSVDTAADVAKDAADVLLLDKDLGVLAEGVTEGRRIFANTIKYVLMGTSSNFGNMFSASVASVVLPFLPMLPGQILLNNLLYDTGQLAIPGDRVDPEQLHAPSHWDIAFIRRFMLLFGSISSLFDFATFALMIFVLGAAQSQFQAGWFIESIATQTLIIFAIRTRRTPFFRSRPSVGLTLASFTVVAVGVWLPYSPLSGLLGFTPLPAPSSSPSSRWCWHTSSWWKSPRCGSSAGPRSGMDPTRSSAGSAATRTVSSAAHPDSANGPAHQPGYRRIGRQPEPLTEPERRTPQPHSVAAIRGSLFVALASPTIGRSALQVRAWFLSRSRGGRA